MPEKADRGRKKATGMAKRSGVEEGTVLGSGITTGHGVAIGGDSPPPSKAPSPNKSRIRRTSRMTPWHGNAQMKVYPVTSNELWGLGGVGLAASLVFSTAAALVGFSVDTAKDLALSVGIAPETTAYWEATGDYAFWAGIALFAVGVLLVGGGSLYIRHIINRTTFDE